MRDRAHSGPQGIGCIEVAASGNNLDCRVIKAFQIISVTELGVSVIVDQQIKRGQIVEMSASFFSGTFDENPLLEVVSITPFRNDLKKVVLMFTDRTAETTRKVQRFISLKNHSGTLMKYPKSR